MDGILQYKGTAGSVKDVDSNKRVVTGYLSAFDNLDHDRDIMAKGAFSKSIAERKNQIFFLNQHNWKQPHGKFNVLQEDEKGLYFESNPLPDVSYSNDVIKLYEAGIINEHSIGFNVIQSSYDKDQDVRIIKEVKLWEGSNVTLGANSSTPFTGMKSLTIKEINQQCALILKEVRHGNYTDETFMLLEIALKQLQADAFELGKKSLTDIKVEPDIITTPPTVSEAEIIKNFINTI